MLVLPVLSFLYWTLSLSPATAFSTPKSSVGRIPLTQQFVSTVDDPEDTFIDGVKIGKYCPSGEPDPPPPLKAPLPKGWKGGFRDSHPKFNYPRLQPDLGSLKMMDNMANIDKLTRQLKIEWPWFSWQRDLGDETTRSYVRFAEYISRIGYDDTGRVWSIICPQQGVKMGSLGEANVEITVTGCRGWIDEKERTLAVDMGVIGQIWFSGDPTKNKNLMALKNFMYNKLVDFPLQKSDSIRVRTNEKGNPRQPVFRIKNGIDQTYLNPSFAEPWDEAFTAVNIAVQIGDVMKNEGVSDEHTEIVDDFNQMIMDVFNANMGNMLKQKNVLSWNIFTKEPTIVNTTEWRDHAEEWRLSLEKNHTDPAGIRSKTADRYFDGTYVHKETIKEGIEKTVPILSSFLGKYLNEAVAEKRIEDPDDPYTKFDHDILLVMMKVGEVAMKVDKFL